MGEILDDGYYNTNIGIMYLEGGVWLDITEYGPWEPVHTDKVTCWVSTEPMVQGKSNNLSDNGDGLDRFDLEERIMDCWGITDDLDMIQGNSEELVESLITTYDVKFQRLFDTYEQLVKEKKL